MDSLPENLSLESLRKTVNKELWGSTPQEKGFSVQWVEFAVNSDFGEHRVPKETLEALNQRLQTELP